MSSKPFSVVNGKIKNPRNLKMPIYFDYISEIISQHETYLKVILKCI